MAATEKEDRKKLADFVDQYAQAISRKDVERLVESMGHLLMKIGEIPESDELFSRRIKLLSELVRDFHEGDDPEIPFWTLARAVFALRYFLDPSDLVPDETTGVGLLDDAMVTAVVVENCRLELEAYCQMKGYNPLEFLS